MASLSIANVTVLHDPRGPADARRWCANALMRARIDAASNEGRKVIVGAQVGETSLLARAGLTLAWAAGPSLVGCELGYGRWLLQHDIASPWIGFGWRGKLRAERFAERGGAGLRPSMLPHPPT